MKNINPCDQFIHKGTILHTTCVANSATATTKVLIFNTVVKNPDD